MKSTTFGALLLVLAVSGTAGLGAARGAGEGKAPPTGAVIEGAAGDPARVDWTRGLVIATGAAAADMRAPSAEIARVRAERQARERARAAARARLDAVELAGRPLGKLAKLGEIEGVGSRIDQVLHERARDLEVRYGSDGSATVTVGVPLEAVRAAVAETAAAASVSGAPAEGAPTALIVDARGSRGRLSPVLGLRVEAGGTELAAPTVYVADLEAARRDPRLGDRPMEARAKRYSRGVLTLHEGDGLDKLAAARQPLVVVVIKNRRRGARSP